MKVSEQMVDDALHQLMETAGEHAALRGARAFKEQMRKSIKAACMQDAEGRGFKSAALQEREAYASARYQEWLTEVFESVVADEEARMRRAGWERIIDVWRTQSSNERGKL